MKLKSTIALCSLGLLTAQAGAAGRGVTDAQTIADKSGTTAIYQTASSQTNQMGTQMPNSETAPQADAIKEAIFKGKIREREKIALSKMNMTDKNPTKGNDLLVVNKTRPDVVTMPGGAQYLAIRADNGVKQTETSFVVCHPCQSGAPIGRNPSDSSSGCCAVGCD